MTHAYLQSKPVEEARAEWMSRFASYEVGEECIDVGDALGRVLARAVHAAISSPHYAAAAMDGFAVESRLTLGAAPGAQVDLRLGQGCFPVDTGDVLPQGCDAVVMIENVTLSKDGGSIGVEQPMAPWTNVRPVGEDIVVTEMLLPSRHVLRPMDLGACLAAGVGRVWVLRQAKVAIIPTGDEVVSPSSALKPGDIIEYNSEIIAKSVLEWGALPVVRSIVKDDMAQLESEIGRAVAESDLTIVIAGSSAGRGDYTSKVLGNLGRILTHGVAMRPGKPVILAEANGKPVLGLPGYPVSAHLCLDQFVKPLLGSWRGAATAERAESLIARITRPVVSGLGVEEHVRVRVGLVNGSYVATPLNRGAGVLTSLVRADGQFVIPGTSEGVASGDAVTVHLVRERYAVDESLVAIGSHDPAMDVLDDMLRNRRQGFLSSSHVGSMGGIIALRKGECHLAGIHLLDTDSGQYNTPFVQRYFMGRQMALVRLAERWQGFIVRPGFAAGMSWHSLTNWRFVNRQKGSGTRMLLDHHLNLKGIDPLSIPGYQREETTHLAVACAILAQEADVGLGVRSVADAMGLDFIPLCLEPFDLLMEAHTLSDPRVTSLLALLRSEEFAERLGAMGGYSTERSGQILKEGLDA